MADRITLKCDTKNCTCSEDGTNAELYASGWRMKRAKRRSWDRVQEKYIYKSWILCPAHAAKEMSK